MSGVRETRDDAQFCPLNHSATSGETCDGCSDSSFSSASMAVMAGGRRDIVILSLCGVQSKNEGQVFLSMHGYWLDDPEVLGPGLVKPFPKHTVALCHGSTVIDGSPKFANCLDNLTQGPQTMSW